MKVILFHDVTNLGEEGDVREVADGFARNFLIPKKLAVPYNKHTLVLLEQKKAAIEKRKVEKRLAAQSLREQLHDKEFFVTAQAGENGKLFGAVTSSILAEVLEKEGITVERKRIEIPEHTIKTLGTTVVRIRLYQNEETTIKITVQAEKKEA